MDTPYVAIHLGTVASTQTEARRRFEGEPLLVTAERQMSGKGRTGNTWMSAPRALAASLAFSSPWPAARLPLIPLVAGLAAVEVVGPEASLKWPNDVMVGDLKVGGLLVEAFESLVVVGFGANLFWPDPMEGAGAILGVDPGRDVAAVMAEHWAETLLERVEAGHRRWGRDEYLARSHTVGRNVSWHPDGVGEVVDIDDDGGLVVETVTGRTTLRSGEVEIVRDAR